MSLTLKKAPVFIADFELQYAWYYEKASPRIADGYLADVHDTLELLGEHPAVGRTRRSHHPRLKDMKSFRVQPPFNRHLIFCRFDSATLVAERVLSGTRDLPRRLREPPGTSGD